MQTSRSEPGLHRNGTPATSGAPRVKQGAKPVPKWGVSERRHEVGQHGARIRAGDGLQETGEVDVGRVVRPIGHRADHEAGHGQVAAHLGHRGPLHFDRQGIGQRGTQRRTGLIGAHELVATDNQPGVQPGPGQAQRRQILGPQRVRLRHGQDFGGQRGAVAEAFASVLKEFRLDAGLSQEQLALRAAVDRTFVGKLESKRHQPSLGVVFALADALGADPCDLVARVRQRLVRG